MLIDKLIDHALNTPFETFDQATVDAAKLRLIDTLSCTVGGWQAGGNNAMLGLIRTWGGAAQASILAHGDKVPLQHAVMMNCLMGRSFDFEVAGPEPEGANAHKMVGHVCSTTDPTAFSTAEFMGNSGKELIAAVILGGDIGARIAVSDQFNFDKCFEVCGTANAMGAAATVGRLMGASHEQLVNAYGILLHMMAGSFQSLWDGVDTFKLPGALAGYNAVLAVELAMKGFKGVKDPLNAPQGYFKLYCHNPQPDNALIDLGQVFYAKGMHKIHPSCYGVHNPIESALEIARNQTYDVADIASVTLEVPPNRIKHFLNQTMDLDDAQPRSLFSIPYGIANALLRREVRIEHYTEGFIRDADVIALSAKVQLVPSDEMAKPHAGRLTVHLSNGERFSAFRDTPLGWGDNPITPAHVREKYDRNMTFSGLVTAEQAGKGLALLDELETLSDVRSLVSCFVGKPAA